MSSSVRKIKSTMLIGSLDRIVKKVSSDIGFHINLHRKTTITVVGNVAYIVSDFEEEPAEELNYRHRSGK